MAIQASLAMQCTVNSFSRFARKNYFYPDLPKGYQISQYDQPLAEHGELEITVDGVKKTIGVTRLHMEDDAGKSIHDGFKDSDRYTYVDLNRSGTPLIEIVSEPDLRSSEEAYQYLTELKQIMQYVGVSECDMEKGQLRCDANVSVRLKGAEKFGTKAEVKNLNSFRFAKMALDYEIARQVALLESGGRVEQETRLVQRRHRRNREHAQQGTRARLSLFSGAGSGAAARERGMAGAHSGNACRSFRARSARGSSEYGVDRVIRSQVLTATQSVTDYFEKANEVSGDPQATANWIITELMGSAGRLRESAARSHWHAGQENQRARNQRQDGQGHLRQNAGDRKIVRRRSSIAKACGRSRDTGALEKIVDEVLAGNAKQVEQYKSGKTTVIGYLVGQVMKASKGQANPAAVNELLKVEAGLNGFARRKRLTPRSTALRSKPPTVGSVSGRWFPRRIRSVPIPARLALRFATYRLRVSADGIPADWFSILNSQWYRRTTRSGVRWDSPDADPKNPWRRAR